MQTQPSLRLVRVESGLADVVVARIDRLLAHGSMAIVLDKTKTNSLGLDLLRREERKFLGGLDIGGLFDETLGKDDVDFFERAVGSLMYC